MGSVFLYQQHTQMRIDNLANWMERSYSAVDLCCFAIPLHSLLDIRPLVSLKCTKLCLSHFVVVVFNNGHFVYALTTLWQQKKVWFGLIQQFPPMSLPSLFIAVVLEESDDRYQLQHLPDSSFIIHFHIYSVGMYHCVMCVRIYSIYLTCGMWGTGVLSCKGAGEEVVSQLVCWG